MRITIILALILTLTACTTETTQIGIIAPISGDAAFIGEGIINGAQLALKEYNSTKYELIIEDDKMEPARTATAFQKLASINKVETVISFSSSSGNVIKPLATENNITHFAIASDTTIADGKNNFVHWTPPDLEAQKWVEEARRRDVKSIAIIALQQQGATAIIEELKKQNNGTIKITSENWFSPGEKDFRTTITKTKTENPEIYFIGAFSPELELLAKQIKEIDPRPMTTIETFEFTHQPELFEGMWYVNAAEPTNEFIQQYETKYEKAPSPGAAHAYDITKIILEKYETRETITKAFEKNEEYHGALGKLKMNSDGTIQSRPTIRIIKNGKPTSQQNQ